VGSILRRKEDERLATGGMFLWGIGNSVGPALRELVRKEQRPKVVFSPMRSKPKAIDAAPSTVWAWSSAVGIDGNDWAIPDGLSVLSRGAGESGRAKASHYALVCRTDKPLEEVGEGEVIYETLVNLISKNRLGHSQVTAVVSRNAATALTQETRYPVGFVAELVYPYFIKLGDPVALNEQQSRAGRRRLPIQASLSVA
jgi:hypothetical protein